MAGQGPALRVRRRGVYVCAKTPVLSDRVEDPMELAGWCPDLEPVSPSNTIELVLPALDMRFLHVVSNNGFWMNSQVYLRK